MGKLTKTTAQIEDALSKAETSYQKPAGGIPKSDLASAVQTSLGKADTALQSYTEQYKGTVTGVKINGTTKNPSSGVVDLGTVITAHQTLKTINGESIAGSGNITIAGGSGTITEIKANGTSVATSGVANIPAASTSAYGVTKLSSSTSSTSTTLAATASAVKAAYDLANSYKGTVTSVKINGTTKSQSSGVVDIGNVVTSVKLNGATYSPTSGVVDLGSVSGGGGSSSDSGAGEQYVYEGNSQQVTLLNNTLHFIDIATNKTLAISTNALEKGQTSRVVIWIFRNTIPTISISGDVFWANDDVPVMSEPGYCYELSFTRAWAGSNLITKTGVLGVWAKYYPGTIQSGAGGGGAD